MDYYSSLFASKVSGGGGSGVTVEPLSVTENGTYQEEGKAYSPVNVNVSGGVSITDIIERTNFPETVVYEGTHAIGNSLFSRVSGLKSFTATENVALESSIFYAATDLESVSMPLCAANGQSISDIFRDCTSLSSVNLPKVKLLGQNIFRNCASLKTLVMQSLTALRDSFAYNAGLQKVDLPVCSSIAANNHFYNCPLEVLVLRNSSVCGLGNIGTFGGTPFASNGTGGTLYVPSSLISSYQSATNWSTILGYANNQIKAIEGSIYETQYADGTPIGA